MRTRASSVHDFALDLVQHLAEQLERFALVFLLRLLLRIAAQVDALAQVIHARQVLLPALVEHVEHDVLFEHAHGLAADLRFLVARTGARPPACTCVGDLLGVDFALGLVDARLSDRAAGRTRWPARASSPGRSHCSSIEFSGT